MSGLLRYSPTLPLQPGVTLIEASAGTGKTWSISSLVVRLLAERDDLGIEQLLVVTFTKAATAELRDRIRARLAQAIAALEQVQASGTRPDDPVLALLGAAEPSAHQPGAWRPMQGGQLAQRLRRLRSARDDFDAHAINTIHGFCQQVLQLHAFESGASLDLELLDDTGPLLAEIVDDFLSQQLHQLSPRHCAILVEQAGLEREPLLKLARALDAARDLPVVPTPIDDWRPCLQRWEQQLAIFQTSWQAQGAQLVARIVAETGKKGKKSGKALSGRSYQARYTAGHLQKLQGWLTDPHPLADGGRPSWAAYFSASKLDSARVAGVEPAFAIPQVAHDWERLLQLGGQLLEAPRRAFAATLRRELPRRLGRRHQQTYDDLLCQVAQHVQGPQVNPALVAALRERFSVALIDEFQDTDHVQWAIFSAIFAGSPRHQLFLIGDPKQAIYAFRGADVFVYRDARGAAQPSQRFTMAVNQRSDGRYVAAMNALFQHRPGLFLLDFIDYLQVDYSATRNPWEGLVFADERPPLQLRWFDARCLPGGSAGQPLANKAEAWRLVPQLVATDLVELLQARPALQLHDGSGQGPARRQLRPRDIAVLVRKHKQGQQVIEALRARGVPAISARSGSVFDTEEATTLERWLAALAEPGRDGPARALAITPLFGWTAAQLEAALRAQGNLAAANTAFDWTSWIERIASWRRAMEHSGFAAVFQRLLGDPQLLARLLALPDAERRLSNLRHLAELLHAAAVRDHLGPQGLLLWLRDRRERGDSEKDAVALRLESEADAVQVVTLHKSKGLQYPVVFLPYLWDGALLHQQAPDLRYHDTAGGQIAGPVQLDLHLDSGHPDRVRHKRQAELEVTQENLRLLYVAFTRARHHAVAYWGPAYKDLASSPLALVLHGGTAATDRRAAAARATTAAFGRGGSAAPLLAQATAELADLGAAGHLPGGAPDDTRPVIAVRACAPPNPAAWVDPEADRSLSLTTRSWDHPAGGLDRSWRRLSYTALTRGHHVDISAPGAAGLAPRPGAQRDHDPTSAPHPGIEPASLPAPRPAEPDVPLHEFPRGTEAGSYVHKLLELLDFSSDPLRERLPPHRPLPVLAATLGRRMGIAEPRWHQLLCDQLPSLLATPLGPGAGSLQLRQLAPPDRLDELDFDLPLSGGDRWRPGMPAAAVSGEQLAEILLLGRPRAEAPFPAEWLQALSEQPFPALCGFLTGSIDLAWRAGRGPSATWFICDYKTNRLGPRPAPGQPARSLPGHYSQPWLRREMARHSYFLQYHLYLVAFHRYLASRLGSAYHYDRHMGGAVYLFLRGLPGPDVSPDAHGQVQGVFTDKPPFRVIQALSRLFDGPGGARP